MSTWMTRSLANATISERHREAAHARLVRRHQVAQNPRPGIGPARITGPIAAVAAVTFLLISLPALSAAPSAAMSAPMPSPTPGPAPSLAR